MPGFVEAGGTRGAIGAEPGAVVGRWPAGPAAALREAFSAARADIFSCASTNLSVGVGRAAGLAAGFDIGVLAITGLLSAPAGAVD
ncbi:hypothetical protein A3D68_00420 [Candidatus Adlerbacteria bacterium RIFCSPHIGHO2_02_FULL_52_17]|uniref:Uncharacterized protein n=1 Tax=Candidatus Adlerbacteria bacterium RIFCSPHIGHO2_02_FULL_52_17 TaxID=1797240 RepID=A0A1F4XNQ6_9BACT|nr:MAG: hypothetical protein A3D68_00420 [Candidatus Adlerbacteria bacterium RIFCSPHIGHO2_02_FULL_52_17]